MVRVTNHVEAVSACRYDEEIIYARTAFVLPELLSTHSQCLVDNLSDSSINLLTSLIPQSTAA